MRWILILASVVLVVAVGYSIMWWRSAPMEPWRRRRHSTIDLRDRRPQGTDALDDTDETDVPVNGSDGVGRASGR